LGLIMFPVLRNLRLRTVAAYCSLLAILLLSAAPVFAQGNSSISQGFQTDDPSITSAALVGIQKDSSNAIELSNSSNKDRLVGVVGDKPLIELSGGGSGAQVVTSGLTLALVSDINGKVVNGDKITASPIEGVGMKATQSTMVVGTAQGDLADISTEEREVTTKDGKKQKVNIGLLPVQVSVSYYTVPEGAGSSFVPSFLQELANQVSGRNVSPVRVLVAALILLLLFISVTVLLYSAVRSSIISIGRNPLSESAVRKSLLEVGLTVAAVLMFATLVIYLVLTV
jgi:hypothetical protein